MRVGLFTSGVSLLLMGFLSLLSFTIISGYIVTLYPLSGYIGIGLILVSFFLIYIGIFSTRKPKYEIVAGNVEESDTTVENIENPEETVFEEWEGEDNLFY